MEEADALSTRIGIMVNGRLQALGTPQKLKNDHGAFFTLELKVRADSAEAVAGWVAATYPTHDVLEHHGVSLTYAIPRESQGLKVSLGAMFKTVEGQKKAGALGIEEYTISQTTLEQVFLAIAKAQVDPEDENNPPADDEHGGDGGAAASPAPAAPPPAAQPIYVTRITVIDEGGEPEIESLSAGL